MDRFHMMLMTVGDAWHASWLHLTSLGDMAVALPCAITLGVWLLFHRKSRRLGWRWVFTFFSVAALVGASKLVFMAWGVGIPALNFIGFSGHSAMATLVWPSLLVVLGSRWGRTGRLSGMGVGLLLAVGVGMSRVMLQAHSVAEVVAGIVLGMVALLAFWRGRAEAWLPEYKASLLWPLALVVPLAYGHRFPSEGLLHAVAGEMNHRHIVHLRHDLYEP